MLRKRIRLLWRFLIVGAFTSLIIPFVLLLILEEDNNDKDTRHDDNKQLVAATTTSDYLTTSEKKNLPKAYASSSNSDNDNFLQQEMNVLGKTIDKEEQNILNFFVGESRALEDGVLDHMYSSEHMLSKRLASKIRRCMAHKSNKSNNQENDEEKDFCTFRAVFVGSAQVAGRDVFRNQTFPFVVEKRLLEVTRAAGLKLEVLNHAYDNDVPREGPQSFHMCIGNLVRRSGVDVIGWGFDDCMTLGRPMQFEAFVRWALLSLSSSYPPALLLVNRAGHNGLGPHGLSRRGQRRVLVEISPGHHVIVYDDTAPRKNAKPYRNSTRYKNLWKSAPNHFWYSIFDRYSTTVDFAAIDPAGAIWHLDHLTQFSNTAFEKDKVLPLVDCGYPDHLPPCNRIPEFIKDNLKAADLSEDILPRDDTSGVLCGVRWGCRHPWYGGPRSHELRGELNALPIIRSFRDAVLLLEEENTKNIDSDAEETTRQRNSNIDTVTPYSAVTKKSRNLQQRQQQKPLPPALFCTKRFCQKTPTCRTSYEPNLGLKLSEHFLLAVEEGNQQHSSEKTTIIAAKNTEAKKYPPIAPRLGIAHFANDPDFQIRDMDKRSIPFGYTDRKFGYRLSNGPKESSMVLIHFTIAFNESTFYSHNDNDDNDGGGGSLVICEPPCYIDACPKTRIIPLFSDPKTTMILDGEQYLHPIKQPNNKNIMYDVDGKFCTIVEEHIPFGKHTLEISTHLAEPYFVMFSHIITFG